MAKPKIQINLNSGQRFQPRVNHRTLWMFYLVCGIFTIVDSYIAYTIWEDEGVWPILLLIGFPCFMLFVIWSQSSGLGVIYHINKQGLYLKRYYSKKLIPFNDIKTVKVITENEAESILSGKQGSEIGSATDYDITGAFKAQLDLGHFITYCSVPIVFSETHAFSGRNASSFGANTDGSFVLLSLENGKQYLISPKENEAFVNCYEKHKNI